MTARRPITTQPRYPILISSTSPKPMDSGPIFTLASPTRVGEIHLSSAFPVLDGMRQRKRNVRSSVHSSTDTSDSLNDSQATSCEEGVLSLFPETKPMMPVRPPIDCCSTDIPATLTRIESPGDPIQRQLKAGSVDSFLGLRAPSISSAISQSTRSTVLNEKFSDDTESHADLSTEVSKPRLRGEVSLWKQLLDFCWSLFSRDSSYAYLSFLRVYPEYKLTWPLDTLRKREYERLKQSDEVYMDYMGASLYPEGLIRSNSTFLCQTILGNTHSFSTR